MSAKKKQTTPNIARADDGTIQITFSVPFSKVNKTKEEVAAEMGKDLEVPGFRKGNAPLNKVIEHIPPATLTEKALAKILPKTISDIINKEKIRPAIIPRFELISAEENKDWQIRATTCEIPKVNLGEYKKIISGASKAQSIWTPDKKLKSEKEDEKPKELTKEQKEQVVIKILLENIKIKIPKVLIDEEVNTKLSRLLERLEKLGLTLESYLASLNKTPSALRKEYEELSQQSISLELTLLEIASKENLKVEKSQVDAAIQASSADPDLKDKLDTPEQRRVIESILRKRAALDSLTSLV